MRDKKNLFLNPRQALLLLGLPLAALGGCSASSVGDFVGQDLTSLASNSIIALTGAESVDARNERLELQPRAPLVIPPGNALQNPGTEVQTAELLGGDWPDDPDVRAREELAALAEERSKPNARENERIMGGLGTSVPLTVAELRSTKPNPNRPREAIVPGDSPQQSAALSPDELLNRRLDPNRVRTQQSANSRLANMSPQERLMEPPKRNAAPVTSAEDIKAAEPEKKSVLERLQFWKRD